MLYHVILCYVILTDATLCYVTICYVEHLKHVIYYVLNSQHFTVGHASKIDAILQMMRYAEDNDDLTAGLVVAAIGACR